MWEEVVTGKQTGNESVREAGEYNRRERVCGGKGEYDLEEGTAIKRKWRMEKRRRL